MEHALQVSVVLRKNLALTNKFPAVFAELPGEGAVEPALLDAGGKGAGQPASFLPVSSPSCSWT
jgi:hypothetical protein